MKGVYIIDLEDNKGFICVANDLTAAQEITNIHRQLYSITEPMEGSFHYFPLLSFETDVDAEIRVYKRMKRLFINNTLYCPKITMDVLAQGTWEAKRASSMPAITQTCQKSPSSEHIFKMSVD